MRKIHRTILAELSRNELRSYNQIDAVHVGGQILADVNIAQNLRSY